MNAATNLFEDLATRAREGDRTALADLRDELHGEVVVLVRQALAGGTGRPEFDQQVGATARRLARYSIQQPPDPERLARRVASCLCDAVCERLGRELSPSQRMQETLCA
jgi:hypothetical protein